MVLLIFLGNFNETRKQILSEKQKMARKFFLHTHNSFKIISQAHIDSKQNKQKAYCEAITII
ncbi:unnamed protein product [Chironomus riparius]|uniref:Uncharacterized protein n=1 Tax=Chironomus riparius TaxID=315576 RepID=A0A9N9WXU1_9DIPT|nr:unnamed protein product [Chironomus riparius]